MLKAIFFDLDGTLLPMNENKFMEIYFHYLTKRMESLGYQKDELIKVIWDGTKAMYQNDGSMTNEEAFWLFFAKHYGEEKLVDKAFLNDYYLNEFKNTSKACMDNSYAKEIVNFCKDNNLKVILSTNPIFPKVATTTRMAYVGLDENDFDFITAYENSSFTKPNPMYFKMLLEKFNLKPEEVILFGNNTYEDGECALACGIKCYLVGDCLIKDTHSSHEFMHIKMEEVIPTIKSFLK